MEYKQSCRCALMGFVGAPVVNLWYGHLTTRVSCWALQVCLDSFAFRPLFALWLDDALSGQRVIIGQHVSKTNETNLDEWLPGLQFWMWAQIVNFNHIPRRFQVLFTSVMMMSWRVNTYPVIKDGEWRISGKNQCWDPA